MTEGKLSSILVANMDITYWSVRSSSMKGGEGVKEVDEWDRYFSQLKVLTLLDSYDNLV